MSNPSTASATVPHPRLGALSLLMQQTREPPKFADARGAIRRGFREVQFPEKITPIEAATAKKPSATATGSQEQFSADPDAGIPLVIGRTGTAGNIAFRRGFDTRDAGDNDRQAFIATLSLGPVAAIEGMTVDKVPTFFGGTGAAVGAFAGFMWSMTQLGAVPEPTALTFGAGGNPPGWTAQSGLSGLAAASWMLRFDTKAKVYQNGVPAPMWTVRGVLAYDPRKDSTYPGGSGSHRMADPSDTAAYDAAVKTWEWTEDPYLMGLRWAHGFWQRDPRVAGSTYQRVMGMGAPWAGIDVAAFVEGANIAKANGWTVGGVIFSGDEKWATMKKILQAGMGEPLALGARISCLVNAPKVSLATITIDDVIGEASVSATQPRRDRFNTVTPRYRLEANNWQLLPGAPISVAAHVAEDRGKRSKVLDYPFIQNTPQVATAARYDIENAREFGPIVLPLKLVWMGYKPGDCITADLPELGLNSQPILLLNRDLDPSVGTTTMTARSETAAKHPFALGQTATPPATPGVTGPMLIPVPGDGAWTISGTSIVSGDTTVPALIVTGAVDTGTAEAVVIEYRTFQDGQAVGAGWRGAGVFEPTLTRQEIVSVQSGTAYEVGVSYRRQGFTGERRIVGPVTTSGAKVDFDAVDGPNKPENGATVGAPVGTNVGDRPVVTIIQQIDKARGDIDGLIASVGEGQTDLSEQVDAANDARDASQAARDQSQAARDAAQSASTLSGAARDAAQTAKAAAEGAAATATQKASDAGGYASTATGQATIATQKADAAGQSATNASASASTASTKAGEASTSAQTAVTAKNDAQGSATSAGSSAGVATQAKTDAQAAAKASSDSASSASTSSSVAGQSATAAAGSATAAGTSAGQASTSAGQASSSAADALGSKNSAASSAALSATTRQAQQDDFARTQPATFAPGDRDAYALPVNATITSGSDLTWPQAYITQTAPGQSAGSEDYVRFKKLLTRRTGRRYRVTTYIFTYATNMSFGLGLYGNTTENWNDGSQSFLGFMVNPIRPGNALGAGSGWIKLEGEFHTDQSISPFYSPRLVIIPSANGVTNNAIFHTTGLVIADITSERAASDFATASNTSAASAAASKDAAGTSASAAETARQAAATARGGAESARDTAVTSASNAQGSANAAASSASLSARTAADGAAATMNDNRSPGAARSLWSFNQYNNFVPDPTQVLPATASGTFSYSAGGDLQVGSVVHIHPTKPSRIDPTRRIRVVAKVRQIPGSSNGDTGDHSLYIACFDKNGGLMFGNVLYLGGQGNVTTVNGPELSLETIIRPADSSPDIAFIRPMYRSPTDGRAVLISQIYWEDVESAQQAAGSANASTTSAASAKASQDSAGASAVAADQSCIAAQSANSGAQTAAAVAQSSAAAADASRAQAQTSATIASSYNSIGVVKNDKFSNWPVDAPNLPTGWSYWATEGNFRVNRLLGYSDSQYAIKTLNDTGSVNSGIYQQIQIWPGDWLMEVTARLDANVWSGSGLTAHGQVSINFATEADTNGLITGAGEGAIRTWSKIVTITQAMINNAGTSVWNFHCMHGWNGFGDQAPRYMTWFMARMRPVDAGDIASKANAARIEAVNRTLADQYGALAQRVSSTEATAGSLASRTGITESAVADLRTKQAAARIELTAASPGGRAKVTIRSDSNNGAGIDLEGDVRISSSLLVGLIKDAAGKTTLDLDTGRLGFQANGYRLVEASGIGPNANMVLWYGPTSVAAGQETLANSRFALGTDGRVYYGGADLAGAGITQTVPVYQSITKVLDAGQSVSFYARVFIDRPTTGGTLYAMVYANGALVGQSPGVGIAANEPNGTEFNGAYTNNTGAKQAFAFNVQPSATFGGETRAAQSYLTI